MSKFVIKSYTKKELSLKYFPSVTDPHTAVNRLMRWIKKCEPLLKALEAQGYEKTARWFSAREVGLIVEYLGDP